MKSLEDIIEVNNIFFNPSISKKSELFKFFGEILSRRKIIKNKDEFINKLLERESKGTTGIGNGIAIPHLRLEGLKRIYLFMALIKNGIDYDAIDGKPVKFVILLIAPEEQKKEYLLMLSQIAAFLHKENVIEKILKCEDANSIIDIFLERERESFYEKYKKLIWFLSSMIITFILFFFTIPYLRIPDIEITRKLDMLRFNDEIWVNKQILSSFIFFSTVIGTLLFWQFRVAIATIGLGVLLITGTMDIISAVEFMSIPTILFIISMMIIISWLEDIGIFNFLLAYIIKRIGAKPRQIFLILIFLSVLLGGLTGEITSILVASTLALSFCRALGLSSFPFIISIVFATNIGSALTLVGNPIGIYIAFSGNLTIEDFFRWATPIVLILTILTSLLLLFIFRRLIPRELNGDFNIDPYEKITDRRKLRLGLILFIFLVLLIGVSKRFDNLFRLLPNTFIITIPLIFSGFIIFYEKSYGKILFKEGVDWWTIIFFMFLFAKAACLEYTGVTTKIAFSLLKLSQSLKIGFLPKEISLTLTSLFLITIFTAITSGFVDNLPIIAALVPIVKTMQMMGLPHSSIIWWGLLFGGCFGGNLTMIGSSANMVALSIYEKTEGRTVGFLKWFKYGLPVTLITIIISLILLAIQIKLAG